jgi:mevalonate kinase
MNTDQAVVSAPGKIILFGEHAVVYGEPALALAIDLRMTVKIQPSSDGVSRVNGLFIDEYRNRYVKKATELFWDGVPLEFMTRSSIPNASGLGSSAAITTSVVGGLMSMRSGIDPGSSDDRGVTPDAIASSPPDEQASPFNEEELARKAFRVECGVQGKSSPTDTSTSTHGSGVIITREPTDSHLWTIADEGNSWCINHTDVPDLTIVLGHSRTGANTPMLVSKVRRFVESNSFAQDVIRDIGKLTRDGIACLRKGDKEQLGELMRRNHDMLAILGINTRGLQTMVDAVRPFSYGAKLTGAGGGGCIIALSDQPEEASRSIYKMGGRPYVVRTSSQGFSIHDPITGF